MLNMCKRLNMKYYFGGRKIVFKPVFQQKTPLIISLS